MVYISSLLGGFTVLTSIGVMSILQGMFKDESCERARTIMFWTTMAALLGSMVIFIINWLPLIPSPAKAVFTSIAAAGIILAIMVGNGMGVSSADECSKGKWMAIVNIIVLGLIEVLMVIFFII